MKGGRLRKRTHVTTVSRRDDVPGVQRGYRRHLLRPERSPTGGPDRPRGLRQMGKFYGNPRTLPRFGASLPQ